MSALTCSQRDALATYTPGAVLALTGVYFLAVPFGTDGAAGLPWLLAHSLSLLVHEAGHAVFSFGGDGLHAAGGTLLQLLLALVFVGNGVWAGHRLGTQAALWWLGVTGVDLSVYAADAPTRALPLLGGLGAEAHDWWWMLIRVGKLAWADEIALAFVALAVACWALAALAPRWL